MGAYFNGERLKNIAAKGDKVKGIAQNGKVFYRAETVYKTIVIDIITGFSGYYVSLDRVRFYNNGSEVLLSPSSINVTVTTEYSSSYKITNLFKNGLWYGKFRKIKNRICINLKSGNFNFDEIRITNGSASYAAEKIKIYAHTDKISNTVVGNFVSDMILIYNGELNRNGQTTIPTSELIKVSS